MVDDSKYIIVPNETENHIGAADGEPYGTANNSGHYLADLVKAGYRIISKQSTGRAVHYVLLKFTAGSKPSQTTPTVTETKTDEEAPDDKPIDLSDIPF